MNHQINEPAHHENTPVLVQNPYTKKVVNIEPFFRVIENNFDGSFKNAAEQMNEIIRKISCFPYNETNGISNDENNSSMLWLLYSFRDMVLGVSELSDE